MVHLSRTALSFRLPLHGPPNRNILNKFDDPFTDTELVFITKTVKIPLTDVNTVEFVLSLAHANQLMGHLSKDDELKSSITVMESPEGFGPHVRIIRVDPAMVDVADQPAVDSLRPTEKQYEPPQINDEEVGGIDLTTDNLSIETRGKKIDFNAPLDPARLDQLQNTPITGFRPVIYQMVPITNLPLILGGASNQGDEMKLSATQG